MADKKLRIKLVKSPIGYNKKQRNQAEILGLKKMNSVAVHYDTPVIRGMVYKIRHLVEVEEFEE
ncbi:MAG: 50S ribosomal protein L30 [Chloroflexota bacterium]